MRYLVTILFFALCGVSYGQTITGTKTRTPGVWLSSKDTATNRTSADSIQIIANRADSSLRFYWSVGARSRKFAFGNDLALKLNISDTAAMLANYLQKSGTLTNRRIPFVNSLGQLKDTAGFTFAGGTLSVPSDINAGFNTVNAGAFVGTIGNFSSVKSNSYTAFGSNAALINFGSGSDSSVNYFYAGQGAGQYRYKQIGANAVTSETQGHYWDKGGVLQMSLNSSSNLFVSGGITATISTAAQPNITSLGTLTGLTVSGSVSATFLDVASNTTLSKLTVNGSGAPTTSIIQSGASGDIIRFGNSSNNSLVTIGYTGLISAPSVSATSLSGTLSTTAQPNITSLGTLSQLTVTGTVKASVLSSTTMVMGPTTNFAGYRYAFAANSGNGIMVYQDNQDKFAIRQWVDNVTDGGKIDVYQSDGSTIGTRIYGSGITSTSIATGGANQAVYANTNGLLTLTPSDSTMKTDVKNLSEFGLADITKLNLVSFKWDSSKGYDSIYGKQLNFGGLAQQFARVNKYFAGYNSNKKHYFIDYDAVRIAHLKATQQLATKVDELKAEINTLKSELEAIKAILLKNNIK